MPQLIVNCSSERVAGSFRIAAPFIALCVIVARSGVVVVDGWTHEYNAAWTRPQSHLRSPSKPEPVWGSSSAPSASNSQRTRTNATTPCSGFGRSADKTAVARPVGRGKLWRM